MSWKRKWKSRPLCGALGAGTLALLLALLPVQAGAAASRRLAVAEKRRIDVQAGDVVEVKLSSESAHVLADAGALSLVSEPQEGVLVSLTEDRSAVAVATSRLAGTGERIVTYTLADDRGQTYSGSVDLRLAVANPLPRTGRVPVLLLNGYQTSCFGSRRSQDTFGYLGEWLAAQGVSSVFFDNCIAGSVAIEQLGDELAELISSLRYTDGTVVSEVDVVAHSMGGLIVRSYLSGKRPGEALFAPPAHPRIRKLITIGTPHFGALTCLPVWQSSQMCRGSKFLADLATWNQGRDDLRGVEYLSIVGNLIASGNLAGVSDGLVSVTSASGGSFPGVADERTRVVPYCHTPSGGLANLVVNCPSGALGIANISSSSHLSWQIIDRFLRNDSGWRSLGTPLDRDAVLNRSGGLFFSLRDEHGSTYTGASQYWFTPTNGQPISLVKADTGIAYHDLLPASGGTAAARFSNGDFGAATAVVAGGTVVNRFKFGPHMALIAPATNHLARLARAPRMLVSVYGTDLADAGQYSASGLPLPSSLGGTTLTLAGRPLGIIYASPTQINAVLPAAAPLYGTLTLTRASGSHSLGLLIEEAVPSLFTANGRGTGPLAAQKADYSAINSSNAAARGDVVILYGTGLGVGRPEVRATIGGQATVVHYAGPTPGFQGLDQINVQIPHSAPVGDGVAVEIHVNGRASNMGTIAIR